MEQVGGARQHDFLTRLRLSTLLARTAREGRCRVFNLDQDLAGADAAHLTDTLTAATASYGLYQIIKSVGEKTPHLRPAAPSPGDSGVC